MRETWLRTNRRALLLGMILPTVLVVIGLTLAVALRDNLAGWVAIVGWTLAGLGAVLGVLVAAQLRTPRLAFDNGELLVFLRAGSCLRIPAESVECFFLGTGAGQIPGAARRALPVRNLVMRLSDRATAYHHRDTKPALGRWEDGYVTIYGAWCEPLSVEVVQRLNSRLKDIQQPEHAKSTRS